MEAPGPFKRGNETGLTYDLKMAAWEWLYREAGCRVIGLKVRIGLNLGEVIKEEEDYFGSAVVIAARIIDVSAGGQILVSDLLRQVAQGPSNSEHEYLDFGRRTLKGFDEEEQIFEVLWQTSAS